MVYLDFTFIYNYAAIVWKNKLLLFASRSKHMQNDNVDIYSIPYPSLMFHGLGVLLFKPLL